MKQYIYYKPSVYANIDSRGEQFVLKQGDIVTTDDGKIYTFGSHTFAMEKETRKALFFRDYTIKEQNRYERIHERAMIAAMHSLIGGLKDIKISSDMHEMKNIPRHAIWFADELVACLKNKED